MNLQSDLSSIITSLNLVENFDEEEMNKLARKLIVQYEADDDSRRDWLDRTNSWLKLATQIMEKKSYPWPDAANVKYPLLTTAAMQFCARAYPSLVPGRNLVSGMVIGRDIDGQKYQRSKRIAAHMSWQLLNQMENWEEDMDKLTMILPIIGMCYKKTYFCAEDQKNESCLVLPQDLVVHYYAKDIERAQRKFHKLQYYSNEIWEKEASGEFLEIEYTRSKDQGGDKNSTRDEITGVRPPQDDDDTPYNFIEAHVWADLDDDGYKEPWVITINLEMRKIVRIVARFTSEGVKIDRNGKLIKITPIEYFTKFGFIPNPDGSMYDLGFGILLGGINETVNTLTNQLLDSGSLNNLQAGFLGKGIRVRGGDSKFSPGEWKLADFTGDDIRKHIFALPTKEPSTVLFSLLETLVTSGKELASIAEIFVGKMPGQNTPATTTMATIEQGEKVFTAIYKRIWKSLGKEYKKIYDLNRLYPMEKEVYFTINQPEGPETQVVYATDYSRDITVCPSADPNASSKAARMMRRQAEGGLLQMGTINPQVFTKRFLEDLEEENIQELMAVQQQPSPEMIKMQMESEFNKMKEQTLQAKQQIDAILGAMKVELEQQKQETERFRLRVEAMQADREFKLEAVNSAVDADLRERELGVKEKQANASNSRGN